MRLFHIWLKLALGLLNCFGHHFSQRENGNKYLGDLPTLISVDQDGTA